MWNVEVQKVINSKDTDDIIHMVIGHTQIKGCWDINLDVDELNFPIDWLCMPTGLADDFLNLIKTEMQSAIKPLKITAIIWQNSIGSITPDCVRRITSEIDRLYYVFPQHSVAFPEIMFLPKLKAYSAKTAKINSILAEYNAKRDYDRYSLHKAGTAKNNWEDGLYLKNKKKFTSFIRKFHLHNFFGSKKENFEVTFFNSPEDTLSDENHNNSENAKNRWMEEGIKHGWIKEVEDKAKANLLRKLILKSKTRIARATKTANKICRKRELNNDSSESDSSESSSNSSSSSDDSSDNDNENKDLPKENIGSKNKRKKVL